MMGLKVEGLFGGIIQPPSAKSKRFQAF